MEISVAFNKTPLHFLSLAININRYFLRRDLEVITVPNEPAVFGVVGSDEPMTAPGVPPPDVIPIKIWADTIPRDKFIRIIVDDWNGTSSRLTISHAEDWRFVKDIWEMFENQIEENGGKFTPKPSEIIESSLVAAANSKTQDTGAKQFPNWFPKGRDKQRLWKRIRRVIHKTQKDYRDELHKDDREPSVDELRDAIAEELKMKKPSAKTVSNVMRAERLGLFKLLN